ncbi:MAG: hypothetical protein AUK47_10555 [Deltaproteobacteria bacterium CG2_30_63_29]|nr:MAG: hypothetical protein AUK47_10555 [Deltaproteobacteria bacterium CG2_30_63_29]PIV99452.1 MAG: hypothetical protein COW42_11025 [Deltaproteobacteria bacterium CG17_big_fil_post_rev_8_21_14_2_50_63_7]PJB48972.1 MAG: hypothetical protein CO108_01350 [Deltaproteobacteria bacterium CG_4_9_14_3_um_filter_63_12]
MVSLLVCVSLAACASACDDGGKETQPTDVAVDVTANDTTVELDTPPEVIDDVATTPDVTTSDVTTTDSTTDTPDQTEGCTASGYTAIEEKATATWGTIVQYSGNSDTIAPLDTLSIQLYYGATPETLSGPGTVELDADPADQNYQTCTTCVLIYVSTKVFYATAGTLTVTTMGSTDGSLFKGTLTNLKLEEVTIDSDYLSTPVVDGATWCIDSYPFSTKINPIK